MEQELSTQNQQDTDTALLDECFNSVDTFQDQSISAQELIKSIFDNAGEELDHNFNIELQTGIAKRILENLNAQHLNKNEKINFLANIMAEDMTFSIVEPSGLISFGYSWENGTMVNSQGDTIEKMAERSLAYDRADSEIFRGIFAMRDAFASHNGTKYAILASPQRDEETAFCQGNFIYLYEFDEIGKKVKAVSIEYPGTKNGLYAFLDSIKGISSNTIKQSNEKTGINAPILFDKSNKINLNKIINLMQVNLKDNPVIKKDALKRQITLINKFNRYQEEFNIKKEALSKIFRKYLSQYDDLETGIVNLCQVALKIVRKELPISNKKDSIKVEKSSTKKSNFTTKLSNTTQTTKPKKNSNKLHLRKTVHLLNNTKKLAKKGKSKKIIKKIEALKVIPLTKKIKNKNVLTQYKKTSLKVNKVTLKEKKIEILNSQLERKQKMVRLIANSNRIASLKDVVKIREHHKSIYIKNTISKNDNLKENNKNISLTIKNLQNLKVKNKNKVFINLNSYHKKTLQKLKIFHAKYSTLQKRSHIIMPITTKEKTISDDRKTPIIKLNSNKRFNNNLINKTSLSPISLISKRKISPSLSIQNKKESIKMNKKEIFPSNFSTAKGIISEKSVDKRKSHLRLKNKIKKIRTLTEEDKIKIFLRKKNKLKNKFNRGIKELASQGKKPLLYLKRKNDAKKIREQKINASREDLLAFMNFLALKFKKKLIVDEWRFNDIDSYEIDIFILLRQLNIELDDIPIIIDIIKQNSYLLELSTPQAHENLFKLIILAVKLFRENQEKLKKQKEENEKQISIELSSDNEEADSEGQFQAQEAGFRKLELDI